MLRAVLRLIQSDLSKVTLFFVLTILASAVISPWIYNVGMLLAEVGQSRTLNPILDWLAVRCRNTPFAYYYDFTLFVTALILIGPFIIWCGFKNSSYRPLSNPWRIRLTQTALSHHNGQALRRNPNTALHLSIGIVTAGSLVTISILLIRLNGWLSFHQAIDNSQILVQVITSATIIAFASEWLFRGMLMGIFLRAMHPALAMVFVSLAYAILCSLLPGSKDVISEPDKADAGFRMVKLMLDNLMTLETFVFGFMLFFCFGLILAYARYRTSSLWLSVSLHLGFLLPYQILSQMTAPGPQSGQMPKFLKGPDGLPGLLPFYLLIISAVLVHIILQLVETKNASGTRTSSHA